MTTLFEEEQHVYCTDFMVTVSHNGNPIVEIKFTKKQTKRARFLSICNKYSGKFMLTAAV